MYTVCLPIRLQQKPRAVFGTVRTVHVNEVREAIVRNDKNMFTCYDSYPSDVPVSKNHRHDDIVLGEWNQEQSKTRYRGEMETGCNHEVVKVKWKENSKDHEKR